MSIKRFVLVCSLPAVIVGCAEFHGSQPPAPVFDGHPETYGYPSPPPPTQQTPPAPKQPQQVLKTRPIPKTAPVPEIMDITPETETEPSPEFSETEPLPLSRTEKSYEPVKPSEPSGTSEPGKPAEPSRIFEPVKPVEPVEDFQSLEPLQSLGPVKPAVGALVSAADQSNSRGNLDAAVATLERAIRIDPRNPALFYKLAELRLKQSKPRLAEDLAKKSALLASSNPDLRKRSWLLIGNARVMQKDYAGAKAARAKAAKF